MLKCISKQNLVKVKSYEQCRYLTTTGWAGAQQSLVHETVLQTILDQSSSRTVRIKSNFQGTWFWNTLSKRQAITQKGCRCCVGFYVPPTAKVIRRRGLGLKSHPKDWRSPGSNSRPLVYKASSLTTTPRRLLPRRVKWSFVMNRDVIKWKPKDNP